jgi:hypothetical protein
MSDTLHDTVHLFDVVEGDGPLMELDVTVTSEFGEGIELKPQGYGDYCSVIGNGCPVLLEVCQGRLRLVVWADINQEEPTHYIDLEGAREDKRLPECVCSICHMACNPVKAHLHQGEYIGDECCWDDRLKASE